MSPHRMKEGSAFTALPSELFGPAVAAEPTSPGQRYTRGPELGRGGMGVVWLVHDHWLHRDVAMKRPTSALGATLHAQLRNEAAVTACLQHPGIATLLDVGEDAEGVFYTMPVLVGVDLAECLKDPSFSTSDAVRTVLLAAQIMAYAHQQGVVHRDLKPSNIFLGQHGEVWVLDWGLATERDTAATGWVGTRGYAAPEQGAEPAHPSADVFGLGRILQAVLPEVAPPALLTVVDLSTKSDPRERWQGVEPFVLALTAWLDGLPVAEHAYPVGKVLQLWAARNRRLLALASVVLLVVSLVATAVLRDRWEANRETRRALARALAVQSMSDWAKGRQAEAEVLAAAALAEGADEIARGVLMSRSPHPVVHLARNRLPCDDPFVANDGRVFCMVDGGDVVHAYSPEGSLLRTVDPGSASALKSPRRVAGTLGAGVVVRGYGGRHEVWGESVRELPATPYNAVGEGVYWGFDRILDANAESSEWALVECGSGIEEVVKSGREYAFTCRDQTFHMGAPGAWKVESIPYPNRVGRVGELWVVSTWKGQIGTRAGGDWTWRDSGVGVVSEMVALSDHRLAVLGEHGGVRVHDLRSTATGTSLPGRAAGLAVDGTDLLVHAGDHLDRWRLPPSEPMAFDRREQGGVSNFQTSASGHALLVGHATGRQELIDLHAGTSRMLVDSDALVAQGSTLWGSGAYVVTSKGRELVDLDSGASTPMVGGATRRSVVVGEAVFAYGWRTSVFYHPHRQSGPYPKVSDVVVEGDELIVLQSDGVLARWEQQGAFRELARLGSAGSIARADGTIWHATGRSLHRLTSAYTIDITVPFEAPLTALVATPHGVMVGDAAGGLTLVEPSGRVRARMPNAHKRKVSGLVQTSPGVVWSASFDGMIRRWSLGHSHVPVEDVEAQWGLSQQAIQLR